MPEVDMNLIREALARRAGGGSPVGGSTIPAAMQISAPSGAGPTGQPSTPTPQPPQTPQAPTPSPVDIATRQAAGGAAGAAQVAQGPNFDDETKKISKALVTKLIQYL